MSSDSKPNKAQYNAMRLLLHFQSRFVQTYGSAYAVNIGRDLKILKKVKTLFEESEQLEELYSFIDLCFSSNPTKPISTPYVLKVANKRFGYIKGKPEQKQSTEIPVDTQGWLKTERQKWGKKLI